LFADLPKDVMKINRDRELNLSLYRHWTLFMSLQHTPYTAMKFRTFSLKGEDKLQEFLADLGIPLNQVSGHSYLRYVYTAMKFRTFSLKGEDKLQEFLADLGIPLNQVSVMLICAMSTPP
jgi:CDC45-like protein